MNTPKPKIYFDQRWQLNLRPAIIIFMEVEVPKIKKDENPRLKMLLPPSHVKCPLRLCTFLKKIMSVLISMKKSTSFT